MKNLDEVCQYIQEQMDHEKQNMKDIRETSGTNNHAFTGAYEVADAYDRLMEFILDEKA